MFRYLLVFLMLYGLVSSSFVLYNLYGDRYDDLDFGTAKGRLTQKGDLYDYMESLQRIIQFCYRNKYDLDMNLEFGLFLTNVNLKLALERKSHRLPRKMLHFLKRLVTDNDQLITYFEYMVNQNNDPQDTSNKMIASLFTNDTKWMNRVRKYTLRSPAYKKSERFYGWQKGESTSIYEYIERIKNYEEWVPSPKESDACFHSLARNPDHQLKTSAKCSLYQPCYHVIMRGSDFGYALSHRLLLLINSRLSRGCHIFSSDKDRELTEKFCKMAYTEIQFVTTQGYEIIDLILEFITLCALEGHANFLRQDWLSNSLRFQTTYGCFGVTIPEESELVTTTIRSKDWQLAKQNHQILGGLCDGHVTSVAAAALSAAIRYILEVYH